MEDNKDRILLNFLNQCGFQCSNINMIDGMHVARELLIDKQKYIEVQQHISLLKNLYSSSSLTSLQANATATQKWPLLNLVRQILRSSGYQVTPKRLCDGYTKDGKKKYKRIFIINKNTIKNVSLS